MASYTDLFLNQFFTTMGQVTAVTISASFVVPMYQYYSLQLKKLIVGFENTSSFQEKFPDESEIPSDDEDSGDMSVVDDTQTQTNNNETQTEDALDIGSKLGPGLSSGMI